MRRRNNLKVRKTGTAGQFTQRGFTLIELMCVIAIILILATISAGHYEKSVVRAKETTLHTDLKVMRDAIQHYTEDKEAAPSSLDDLVSAHYIQQIPNDPMTNAKDWVTTSEDFDLSPEQSSSGITDVHSASDTVSPFENTPYSSW
ncbi:MAG: prepilin-type N-terminal cleavage/methylation domain-containing protein [Candidatus Acidiferrales bacterium]